MHCRSVTMKAAIANLLLPAMALASATAPSPATAADSLIVRPAASDQATSPVQGAACTDEGDWFCAISTYQRCASGQWSVVSAVATGTECTPYGLSHNSSILQPPPYFSIIAGGSVPYPSSEPLPIALTTTTVLAVSSQTVGASTSSSVTMSATTTAGSSATSSAPASGSQSPTAPKTKVSDGFRSGGVGLWVAIEVVMFVGAQLL